jgi:hypothetical protein
MNGPVPTGFVPRSGPVSALGAMTIPASPASTLSM